MIFLETKNDNEKGQKKYKNTIRVKKDSVSTMTFDVKWYGALKFFVYPPGTPHPLAGGKGDLAKSATSFAGWFIAGKPLYKKSAVKILAVWFIQPEAESEIGSHEVSASACGQVLRTQFNRDFADSMHKMHDLQTPIRRFPGIWRIYGGFLSSSLCPPRAPQFPALYSRICLLFLFESR